MSARAEREILVALFAALDRRERAADLADDPLVVQVARRHRLTPLLSARCRGALAGSLEETCHRDHVLTAARNLALSAIAEECVGALAASGVEVALLKGLAYERTLYEAVGARPTSDVDLLVRERDRRAAFDALDRLGFEPKAAAPGFDDPDYHEVAWRRDHVEVDLHMALAPLVRCAIDPDAVWRDRRALTIGATRARALSPPHAAVFHALHMTIDHFDVPGLYPHRSRPSPARAGGRRDRRGDGARMALPSPVHDERGADSGLSAALGGGPAVGGPRGKIRRGHRPLRRVGAAPAARSAATQARSLRRAPGRAPLYDRPGTTPSA